MSAFIVQDETINLILAGLEYGDYGHYGGPPKPQGLLAYKTAEDQAELGAYLFNMNIDSIEQRYGKGEAEKFRDLDYKFQSVANPSMAQLLKSIGCLNYQCCEGDIPETALYKALNQYEAQLAHTIATHTPEYKKAQWG